MRFEISAYMTILGAFWSLILNWLLPQCVADSLPLERLDVVKNMFSKLTSSGAILDATVTLHKDSGLFLKSSKGARSGEALVILPIKFAISSGIIDDTLDAKLQSFGRVWSKRNSSNNDVEVIQGHEALSIWRVRLSLQLLLLSRRNDGTTHSDYIQLLKLTPLPPSPLNLTRLQRSVVAGTYMRAKLHEFKAWRKYLRAFSRSKYGASLFNPPLGDDELAWAWGVSSSRPMDLGEHTWLFPVLDLANHVDLEHRNIEHVVWSEGREPAVALIATRDIAPDEELVLCYGPWDNLKFLMDFGFTIKSQDIGPTSDSFEGFKTLDEFKSVCEWYTSVASSVYSGCLPLSETWLACLFLTELPSQMDALHALKTNYRALAHDTMPALLQCVGKLGENMCRILHEGRTSSIFVTDLLRFIEADYAVLEYVHQFCASEVKSAVLLESSGDWKRIQADDDKWSRAFARAAEHCHRMQRGCDQLLTSRMKRLCSLRKKITRGLQHSEAQSSEYNDGLCDDRLSLRNS